MTKDHGTHLFNQEQQHIFDTFVNLSGIKIEYVKPDLSWLRQLSGVI